MCGWEFTGTLITAPGDSPLRRSVLPSSRQPRTKLAKHYHPVLCSTVQCVPPCTEFILRELFSIYSYFPQRSQREQAGKLLWSPNQLDPKNRKSRDSHRPPRTHPSQRHHNYYPYNPRRYQGITTSNPHTPRSNEKVPFSRRIDKSSGPIGFYSYPSVQKQDITSSFRPSAPSYRIYLGRTPPQHHNKPPRFLRITPRR